MATTTTTPGTVYCQKCGAPMTPADRFCRKCGCDSTVPLWTTTPPRAIAVSDRKRLVALILWFFLGIFGAHRFYAGRIGTAFLWLFTLGLLGIGWLYDLVLIAAGEFRDSEGRRILIWT